jgi:hypothetical protein
MGKFGGLRDKNNRFGIKHVRAQKKKKKKKKKKNLSESQ